MSHNIVILIIFLCIQISKVTGQQIRIDWDDFNRKYSLNLMRLHADSQKAQALEDMGGIVEYKVKVGTFCKVQELTNPVKNEIFSQDGIKIEILYFITKIIKSGCSVTYQTVPLIFNDGILVGVGKNQLPTKKTKTTGQG